MLGGSACHFGANLWLWDLGRPLLRQKFTLGLSARPPLRKSLTLMGVVANAKGGPMYRSKAKLTEQWLSQARTEQYPDALGAMLRV